MPAESGQKRVLFGLALFATAFAVYLPAIRGGFVWDDDLILWDNPLITSANGLVSFWLSTLPPDYFPLSSSMLWLEWRIFGPDHPWGYHALNVLLHAGSSVVLWRLLLRLGIPGAWLAALIFAVHPVNVEAVAWIAQRKSTLSFFLAALAALFFERSRERGDANYWLALIAFLFALLAKTSVAMLPVALLVLEWWRSGGISRAHLARTLPFFFVAGALSIVTIWFQYHVSIGDDFVRDDGFLSRLALSGRAIWFYLGKALLPLNLIFMYPRWEEAAVRSPLAWIPLGLVLISFFALWRLRARPRARAALAALAIYVAMLLPVLGFFDIYFMRYSLVADHWQYPAIPAVIAPVAAVLAHLAGRARARAVSSALAALLLAALGTQSWRQAEHYRDEETLWRATLARNPLAWAAHENLGILLSKSGRLEEGVGHLRVTLQLQPDRAASHSNLAAALSEPGQAEEAAYHYRRALELDPSLATSWYNAGNILSESGRIDEAIAHFRKAVELDPGYANAHANLAALFKAKGQTAEAIAHSRRAVELDPDLAPARFNLGNLLLKRGEMREARVHLEAALEALPDNIVALASLAWILATAPEDDLRDGRRAIALAARADNIEANNPEILRVLAAALAEAGRMDEAIATAHKALSLVSAGGSAPLADPIRGDLDRYAKGLPVRDERAQGRGASPP